MTEEVGVRVAEPADARAIRRVAREAWHAAYDGILGASTVDEAVDEWYNPERLAESAATADHVFLVAAAGDDVVGFTHGGPWQEEGSTAELYRLYVRPGYWGHGVGTRLLDAAGARLRERGYDRLRLVVFADNDVGVTFYETRGFERVAEHRDRVAGEEYPEYVYERAL
ncbi:GNAT family N-acetyltransferase [Halobacteriaceae archaeon GCM10025711]